MRFNANSITRQFKKNNSDKSREGYSKLRNNKGINASSNEKIFHRYQAEKASNLEEMHALVQIWTY